MSEEAQLWTKDKDELRRAFVYSHFPWSVEFKAGSQIRAMEAIFRWLKSGTVPVKKRTGPLN